MSLREDVRRLRSHLKTEMKSIFGRDGASSVPTSNPEAATPTSLHPSLALSQALPESGSNVVSQAKLEGWANLKACLDVIGQVASTGGLGPLKMALEGLADCTRIYEDAAQGRRAYTELPSELEDIFQELQQYIDMSPTVANNVSGICRLLGNEVNYVKNQQARSVTKRLSEAERDEDDILECYKRMRNHLQTLSRKMGVSTLAIVEQHTMDDPVLSLRGRGQLTRSRGG
ncbi:unnamed protein product [Rhizoctonia solani]|uniref:Uncharacterized protein n=1 Tax=Rhizoctonia solani TaxID=456999 RepID=A0A8H3HJZ1_9AGAM|nr:unnamed protein product [Rhizoctonia solani]